MARQTYNTRPWEKNLEVYWDFSGGLNTISSLDTMNNNELRVMVNQDLTERGSTRRRYGMILHKETSQQGFAQGSFRYYHSANHFTEIEAVNGHFEIDGEVKVIENLEDGFQSERQIEGVQFGDKMYFATGTKLVEFDGEKFKVVEPYKPQPLEALYIGTNGLAPNPNDFMQDGVYEFLRIDGVTFSKRYGVVNEPVTLTAYVSKPHDVEVEFQFEWRYAFMEEGKWVEGQAWSSKKTWDFTPDASGDFQFRINMREKGLTVAEHQYLVPKYVVKASSDSADVEIDTHHITTCNRILLHWNRLILYGDTHNPDMIYISHLNNPAYFPVPNTLRFENGKKEGLTVLVQYRDMLIAFTDTSIQALFGQSPQDYRRAVLNTSIGCIAPYSAVVVKNYIYFLSSNGVHFLKSVGYVDDKANVEKLDSKIDNIVPRDRDACGFFHNNQYHLVFPTRRERLRYYIELGAWVKDESERLDFIRMFDRDGFLSGQSHLGPIRKFNPTVYDDDGYIYEDIWETKSFDFGQPYHRKKLKELQLTMEPQGQTIRANIYVFADAASVLNAEKGEAYVDENGEVGWRLTVEPNLVVDAGTTFGGWEMGQSPFGDVETAISKFSISGRCIRVRVRFAHKEAKPVKAIGLAFIFKLKKP